MLQQIRSFANGFKWTPGTLSDIEQRLCTIGHIQHPEQTQLEGLRLLLTCHVAIQTSPSQLRFTLGALIDIAPIALQYVKERETMRV